MFNIYIHTTRTTTYMHDTYAAAQHSGLPLPHPNCPNTGPLHLNNKPLARLQRLAEPDQPSTALLHTSLKQPIRPFTV